MFGFDDFLWFGLGTLIGAGSVVSIVCIAAVLDSDSIKETVVKKFPDAFKILIKKKKKNAVNVGIFNKSDYEIKSDVKIEAQEGVADSIYIGQVIYV